jgi:hypothetical protein
MMFRPCKNSGKSAKLGTFVGSGPLGEKLSASQFNMGYTEILWIGPSQPPDNVCGVASGY